MAGIRRMTAPTADVLGALAAADEPMWGLRVIKATGRAAGTVYPILDRLEHAGWVESQWEDDPSRPGPRRRYYTLTEEGRTSASEVLRAFAASRRVRSRPDLAHP